MSLRLGGFLQNRANHALRYLLREVESVTDVEAFRYSDINWQAHKYGIGQDGSIAGIVYHVVAWKMLSLPLFGSEGQLRTVDDFHAEEAPDKHDWAGIQVWLAEVGAQWNEALSQLSEAELEALRPWGKHEIPVWEFVTELIEHDIQHASQIEYIRQRMRAEEIK